jgi:hypothetical protein
MLMHEAHAVLPEFARRERQRNLRAADLEAASGVRRVKAGEDLDERRLAAAVLAQKAVDFAWSDFKRRVIEGLLAPEGLAEVPKPKRRDGRRRRGGHAYWSFHRSA